MCARGNHLVRRRSSQVQGGGRGSQREGDPELPGSPTICHHGSPHSAQQPPPCTHRPNATSLSHPVSENHLTFVKTEEAALYWDLPTSPVVKTPPSNVGGVGVIPGQGT